MQSDCSRTPNSVSAPTIEDGVFIMILTSLARYRRTTCRSIEAKMKEIIKANSGFVKSTATKEEARKTSLSIQPYKTGTDGRVAGAMKSPFTDRANFTDMCRGPHIRLYRGHQSFKLLDRLPALTCAAVKNVPCCREFTASLFNNQKNSMPI